MSNIKTAGPAGPPPKDKVAEIANTLEWLATAFILAFVFRAFVMEAFRIPTGSMADTLMGAHFRVCCSQCGYKYNYGFIPQNYGLAQDEVPSGIKLPGTNTRCPSCGYYQKVGDNIPVANGDRILVLKCLYQFFEPKQWDVAVFRNPVEPAINYIKRLIGRPGEKVEIIDGDIYINDRISRKPPKVQQEMWSVVYDNDYQPVRPTERLFNGHIWQQPLKNITDSKWENDPNHPTVFSLDSSNDHVNSLYYDSLLGNDFRAGCAYNDMRHSRFDPLCSDLMARFHVNFREAQGCIGIELTKYQLHYKAWVSPEGKMFIAKNEGQILAQDSVKSIQVNQPTLVSFSNVDHVLTFTFGDQQLVYDLGLSADSAGRRLADIRPYVEIFGAGKMTISHIAIFKDNYYFSKKFAASPEQCRAGEGNALTLGKNEYFVLGDNSPSSEDGRWWTSPGKGNNGRIYPAGIVPGEYLVGRALFVYWPGGFRPFPKSQLALVPNIGQMRPIYGGSDKQP